MKGVIPSMILPMGSTPIYKGCRESLRRVDCPTIHRMGCTPFYKGCGESLKDVDPLMIHRMGCTPI